MTHLITWDHSGYGCDHDFDEDPPCSPDPVVTCSGEPDDRPAWLPGVAWCRTYCTNLDGTCDESFAVCIGDAWCESYRSEQEQDRCDCGGALKVSAGALVGIAHESTCISVTSPLPLHPAEPHCTNGHPLKDVGECFVLQWLNNDPEQTRDDADGDYHDGPIDVEWDDDYYTWSYTS